VIYGRQAGTRANGRAAFRQAATYFEQALAALGYLPDSPDTRGLAIELRHDLVGRALSQMGEYGKGLALLREAETLARALGDQARLAQVLPMLAFMLRQKAEFAGALAAGQQALALATARGDFPLRVAASHFLGLTYWAIGDYKRAAELFRWNVEVRDPGTGRPALLLNQSRAWLAYTLSQLGRFTEGRDHGEEALRRATPEGHGAEPMVTHLGLGRLYLAQGDLEAAIRVLDRGLVLCRTADNRDSGRAIAGGLGYAYALAGRHAEGRALLEETLKESRRMGALHSQSLYVAQLSAVCLLAGCVGEARQHAHQALALARQYGERGFEALALCQLGAVHAHADALDAAPAEAHYQQALALAEALGMRPLVAHCHLGLGRLYHQTGQRGQARAALTTAVDLYRAMDMTFWLPQAEAALAQME
jgi:tetratricopeptide (TPR) repeat protein